MCFSPEASFTTSAVLGVAGVMCLSKVKNKEEIPLASIPFLFAIQQLIEGFLWLSDKSTPQATALTYAFLFFAYFLWPIIVPFAYYCVEIKNKYKTIFKYLLAVGVVASTALLALMLTYEPIALLKDNHICYELRGFNNANLAYVSMIWVGLYLIAVNGVGFFSSFKYLRIFSLTSFIAFLVSTIFYYNAWQSVWCFFSAILSAIIYLHLKFREKWGE